MFFFTHQCVAMESNELLDLPGSDGLRHQFVVFVEGRDEFCNGGGNHGGSSFVVASGGLLRQWMFKFEKFSMSLCHVECSLG